MNEKNEQITITNENISSVVLKGVTRLTEKSFGLPLNRTAPANKVTAHLNMMYTCSLGDVIGKASEADAILWYNNHRPDVGNDAKGNRRYSDDEVEAKQQYLENLANPLLVDTVTEIKTKKVIVKTYNFNELYDIIKSGNEAQIRWAKDKIAVMSNEGDKAKKFLAEQNKAK